MTAFLLATALVALAEMGDKTQLLAFLLATRFRQPVPIVLGILVATLANHAFAGAIGVWITQFIGQNIMQWVLGLSFIIMGAWILIPDKIDEDELALQQGKVRAQFYGELTIPVDTKLIQQMKCASPDSDELVQTEIAAFVSESLESDVLYLFGVGSTCGAIMAQLGYEHTLLGFDAVLNGALIGRDLNSESIWALVQHYPSKIILTATGGQGILIGRGNQQLTPQILKYVGRDNLWVVASPNKLQALAGRGLVLDTGDAELNKAWQGLIKVTTGYEQTQLYYVGQ